MNRRVRHPLAGAVWLMLASAPAFAQEKPVEINFGAGATFPTSDFGNSFDIGLVNNMYVFQWNGAAGVTFNVNPVVGIQAEYMYHQLGGPNRTFPNLAPPPAEW